MHHQCLHVMSSRPAFVEQQERHYEEILAKVQYLAKFKKYDHRTKTLQKGFLRQSKMPRCLLFVNSFFVNWCIGLINAYWPLNIVHMSEYFLIPNLNRYMSLIFKLTPSPILEVHPGPQVEHPLEPFGVAPVPPFGHWPLACLCAKSVWWVAFCPEPFFVT